MNDYSRICTPRHVDLSVFLLKKLGSTVRALFNYADSASCVCLVSLAPRRGTGRG